MTQLDPARVESLGPAERIIGALLAQTDHMVHNRPGMVVANPSKPYGVQWSPVTTADQDGVRTVYRLDKRGRKSVRTRVGVLDAEGRVVEAGRVIGTYRAPGLYPEVAAWLYRQIAEVWKLDNEFAARWASWSFAQDHRDLKVALAAFMLVQTRAGEPVVDGGEVLFFDDDHRAVGEAMCLLRRDDRKDLNPKLLLRVGDLLELDGVAAINRELGFGRSARTAPLGRYPKAVTKWLRHREDNPHVLEGLVKAGFRSTVMKLARRVGYKPQSPKFFEILRWKQKQAEDGRRELAIGAEVKAAESWKGLSEAEICRRIVETGPSYKRIVGLLPSEIGVTRAIMAAAIEAGSLSDRDLVILSPTLEDLGLLEVPEIGDRWLEATQSAEDQRAARIAERVRGSEAREALQQAADKAVQKAVAEAVRGLRVYVGVDISASMNTAIEKAKVYLTQFLHSFPMAKLTVAVFNTRGREVAIRHASSKGIEHAFKGIAAGGGTDYGAAVTQVFAQHPPDADEDALFVWVGDQQAPHFEAEVRASGLNPVAFGFLYVPGSMGDRARAVESTAQLLGIPCFRIEEDTFADVYAVPRTLRRLIASTPVSKASQRTSLVETILKTELLAKPVWA